MSRVSRIDFPLSMLSSTASRRECFCTARASAYKWRARACGVSPLQAGSARRAAETAASTSAFVPSVTRAIVFDVDGLMTSNVRPGSVHAPSMKCPNTRSCFASHPSTSLSLSGAGPYSIVLKISATVAIGVGVRAVILSEQRERRTYCPHLANNQGRQVLRRCAPQDDNHDY